MIKSFTVLAVAVLLIFSATTVYGDAYVDTHDDGTLAGWTSRGKRGWIETDGCMVPKGQTANKGFLINDSPSTDDGTFTFTMKGIGNTNSLDGGGVFRFTDNCHFYFVSVYEANANDVSPDNELRLKKNSTDASSGYVTIKDSLDFIDTRYLYTIKVKLRGPVFTFWLNGDSLGQYVDTANPSGSVGYAYDDLWDPYVGFESSSWVDDVNHYFWDISANSGIQAGSGIWGSNKCWTPMNSDGTLLFTWPGAGNCATFSGADGEYIIAVNNVQSVDSITFINGKYTVKSGTINLVNKNSIYVSEGTSTTIGSIINSSAGMTKYGEGALILAGSATLNGATIINAGTLQLGNGGATGMVNGSIVNNGTLIYNKTTIDSINEGISGSGRLFKYGTGILLLSGKNTYAGTTTVSQGTLLINGSLEGSNVSVTSGAAIGGTGIFYSSVTVDEGTIAPGGSTQEKLEFRSLEMTSSSILNFDLGKKSDTIVATEKLTLNGTINFSAAAGLTPDTYRIINCNGLSIGNTLRIGSTPEGARCELVSGNGFVNVIVSSRLIRSEPKDTFCLTGGSAAFTVAASGKGSLVYEWFRFPSMPAGTSPTLSLSSITQADAGTRFRCIVKDDFQKDSSRWALLTVINAPEIAIEPRNTSVAIGEKATLSLSVKDTALTSYSWYRVGKAEKLGTSPDLRIANITHSDTGSYYCIIANPAGQITSDTVHLRVQMLLPSAAFIVSPQTGTAPHLVTFTDISTGNVISRRWEFGDGESDTIPQPSHLYTTPGTYSITLIVTNSNGADTLIKIDSVIVYDKEYRSGNTIVINTLCFDTASGSFMISWCIDSVTAAKSPEIAISYGFSKYPAVSAGSIFASMNSLCMDTVVQLNELAHRDASMYIALWLRYPDSTWIEPTDASRRVIRLGSPFRETVTFFDSSGSADTVTVFDGKIVLWKDHSHTYKQSITDTMEIIKPVRIPSGMIPVSEQFIFKKSEPAFPYYIGIRIDSLPEGSSIHEVRIYSSKSGTYNVNRATVIDSENKIIYAKSGTLHCPIIAMLDTLKPDIMVYSDTGTPITSFTLLRDSIRIVDNIANVQWRHLVGNGGELPALWASGTLNGTESPISLTIPDTALAMSQMSGLRTLLVIDDGCHNDTLDLSRSIYRKTSDTFVSDANRWIPLYATAVLDTGDAGGLVEQLSNHFRVESYNRKDMRLFRWCNLNDNNKTPDKWVEYDADQMDARALFSFDPGRLVWLKTREDVPLQLGSGYTLSLKDTFTIDLSPKQWTDFGMPYRFSVCLEDILGATGNDAELVSFYRWRQDAITGMYTLDPYFVQGMPDKADASKTIDYIARGGYSIYNRHSKSVKLRIPPVPPVMTNKLKKRTTVKDGSWSVKFIGEADDRTVLSPVYFGYAPVNHCYPLPPSFADLRLSVLNRETSQQSGHSIDENAKNGLLKELLVTNNSDSIHSIAYHMERVGTFPINFSAYCYNIGSDNRDSGGTFTIAPRSVTTRLIIVGDAEFHNNFISKVSNRQFALLPFFPNPARSIVNIRYMVPFGAQENITIVIYNILGKKVWQISKFGLPREGLNQVTWNGMNGHGTPVVSGLYVVQLEVRTASGKVTGRFESHVTLVR